MPGATVPADGIIVNGNDIVLDEKILLKNESYKNIFEETDKYYKRLKDKLKIKDSQFINGFFNQ